MAHVVIIGAGVGGVPCASAMGLPVYERYVLKALGIVSLKETRR
jgi:predicted NAD/FAD-dependent oxidoreductase